MHRGTYFYESLWKYFKLLLSTDLFWRRPRRLWWTSGETLLTTPHWPSTARLWRESAALNSWGCTSQRTLTWTTNNHVCLQEGTTAPTLSPPAEKSKPPLHHPHHLLQGTIESVLTSYITVWYGNCCATDHKTLQRTVNTAAKIIGAPLPSIMYIFLTRCSSKAKSILKDPTHPSHSLFELLPSGRRYRSIRARSARLLNSFFPQAVRALNSHHTAPLWNPKQTPHPHLTTSQEKTVKLLFLCNSSVLRTGERACTSHL